jgi:hypothetical protein
MAMSGPDLLDDGILAVATFMAAVGVGWVILDELRAARAEGGRFSSDLAWTLLWAIGLGALFVFAWASRRHAESLGPCVPAVARRQLRRAGFS